MVCIRKKHVNRRDAYRKWKFCVDCVKGLRSYFHIAPSGTGARQAMDETMDNEAALFQSEILGLTGGDSIRIRNKIRKRYEDIQLVFF